jgi:hypothetical protein
VLGEREAFHNAVDLVIAHVSFESNVTVQVFEASIRSVDG